MSHLLQERFSELVMHKIRAEAVLKDGVVFNTDYEGTPKAGMVRIPVRDSEVAVSDYDVAKGLDATEGITVYDTLFINNDKAVNEIIDGYEAAALPDRLVAERLDSAGYALAHRLDTDGGNTLLAGATPVSATLLTKDTVYAQIVDLRTLMSKAGVPNDGRRFLLVTPDTMALILKSPEFISAASLGDEMKETGAVGKIAGFCVIEWSDAAAGLCMLAGHPRYATRATEWALPVHLQDLSQSGKYIGACAVQGRYVYGHKVLRPSAFYAVYAPSVLGLTATSAGVGKLKLTVTGSTGTLKYVVNPAARQAYHSAGVGTALTSGTTVISARGGDVIEVCDIGTSGVEAVGYYAVTASDVGE